MSKSLLPTIKPRFCDSNNLPLSGGKLYSYVAGTTTPQATYIDPSGDTPNTNPIILDANGECDIYVGNALYKFVLTSSADVVQWTKDNVRNPAVDGGEAEGAAESAAAAAAFAADAANSVALIGTISSSNIASAIVQRDGSGNFAAGTITANLTGNASGSAASFTGSLAGDVTGTQSATAISAATVTGKALTGYTSGAGTVGATDSILQAIQKLNGNDGLKAPLASPTFTGAVTAPALTLSTTPLAIGSGGTGQTTKAAAFDALQPMTTSGDIIYGGASGAGTRLAKGSDGQVLKLVSGLPAWGTNTTTLTNPTVQKFTSGSGTYTTPTSPAPLYIRVRMVGGGGGGGSSGSASWGAASDGGNTSFGTTLLVANGGTKATTNSGGITTGGAGGTASLGTGPVGIAQTGGGGASGEYNAGTTYSPGGAGGTSCLGSSAAASNNSTTGNNSAANSGAGGPGCGTSSGASSISGSGGGAGGFVDAIINSPLSTYSYAVGAGGAGGSAGTSGGAGGAGGSGIIVVTEFYQ